MRLATIIIITAALAVGACGKKAPEDKPAQPTQEPTTAPTVDAVTPPETGPPPTAEADAAAPAEPADAAVAPAADIPPAPVAKKVPVTETYHGVEVTEDYRWLEDPNDPEVKAWVDAENKHARAVLAALPDVDLIRARVQATFGSDGVSFGGVKAAGGHFIALERKPPKQQPFLIVTDSLDDLSGARTLVDPNALDAAGTTAIDFFEPSPDGALVAVSLSKSGTESGDVHIFDVASGKDTGEVVPRVNGGTAGGSLAWLADGKGFLYTRYPRGDERPEADKDFYVQVYKHLLGTSTDADTYEMGKDQPRIAEYDLRLDPRTGRVLATIQNGDGGQFAHYLRDTDGSWRGFTGFDDKVISATFGPNDTLYVMSRKDAPKGKILAVPIASLDVAKGRVIVPEGENSVVEGFWGPPTVLPMEDRLYVVYQLGGPSQIAAFDLDGKPVEGPTAAPVTANGGLVPLAGNDVLFQTRSFVAPTAYFRYDAAAGTTTKTALSNEASFDLSDVEVRREMATSKDGTKVPVNILLKKGMAQDGTGAGILTGYGGYGVNIEPGFSPRPRIALDQGVIYAVANLRGGGEFGEAWHRGGNLTNKQNVFDDFAAAAQYLIDQKYVAPGRLGIVGGSNGGLLMGATLTQHPDLPAAVVSFVGIYDMLRVELSPNGAFNVPEFGTVKDEAQFKAMVAYSPYHAVKDGVAYPPTLFLTGENDPRVDPMQSRKMTARLQAAVATSPEPATPILLRTTSGAGHGGDTRLDEQIAQWTDVYAFFFQQLGVEVKPFPK